MQEQAQVPIFPEAARRIAFLCNGIAFLNRAVAVTLWNSLADNALVCRGALDLSIWNIFL